MQEIIKKNIWFLVPYTLVGLTALVLILFTSKPDLHLAINQFHNSFLDGLMKFLTFFGHGLFACSLAVVLLFWKIRYSVYLLVSYLSSGLVIQLLKHVFFPEALRPVPFLAPHELHLVQGISILNNYSFPSGHAATAFAVFFVYSKISSSRVGRIIMAITAILVAFSRTYLSQHFLEDILVGSFIGILAATASIYLTDNIKGIWKEKTVLSLAFNRKPNDAVH